MQIYNSLQYLGCSLSSNGSSNCSIYSPDYRVQSNVKTKFVTSISTGALTKQHSHVTCYKYNSPYSLPVIAIHVCTVALFTSLSLASWLALEVEPNEFNIRNFSMQNNTKLTLSRLSQWILWLSYSYRYPMKRTASQYIESYFVPKVNIRPLETQVTLSATQCQNIWHLVRDTHTRHSYKIH